MAKTIVFIDSRVNDIDLLVSQFDTGTEYYILNASADGVLQIESALTGKSDYDSIQIISHGSAGSITIGSTLLTENNLSEYQSHLESIGHSLTDNGDLLLYGCSVGAGATGHQFIDTLSHLINADVAASDNLTGGALAGGDWTLEVSTGPIEANQVIVNDATINYNYVFGDPTELVNQAPTFLFLNDGKLVDSTYSDCYSAALQPDGKILVAGGNVNAGGEDFCLARFDTNGRLDTTFGGGSGWVITDFASQHWDEAHSIIVQKDGKILVGGSGGDQGAFALARYNPDGSLDTTFSGDGKVISDFGTEIESLFLQSDGKILAGGYAYLQGGNIYSVLARYNVDGSLDTSFAVAGKSMCDFLGAFHCITQQADGKILAAMGSRSADFGLVRYDSNGHLDTTFGDISTYDPSQHTGQVTTDFDGDVLDAAYSMVLQSDGKIILAGYSNHHFALARYNSNGSLDTSFDGNGKVTTDFGGFDAQANSVTLQPDGKILVAGYTQNSISRDFALARYNVNGSLDTTFGNGLGIVTSEFGATDEATSVIVEADGKIIVTGSISHSIFNVGLARYNPDGSPDTSFGNITQTIENGAPVILDNDVQIFDAELSASGNYAGASLLLQRNTGANSEDHFSAKTSGSLGALTEGSDLLENGNIRGQVITNSAGTLLITFNSDATNAIVNSLIQQIAYSNSSDNPPDLVQINWTFSDGNTGDQGTGGALSATGSSIVQITPVNDAPTLTAFNAPVDTTSQNTPVAITLAELKSHGNAADVDGTVDAFVIKALSTGTLKIGLDEATATAYDAVTNNTIDATHQAYWTPNADITGTLNAFTVVARDNSGAESTTAIQATVSVVDSIPPTVSTFSPADAATGVAIGSDIVLTFSEPIQKGTGSVEIHSGSAAGPLVASYDAATSTNLTVSGNTLRLNPSTDLGYSTHYFVTFAAGTIQDTAGNSYAGTSTYDFTTIPDPNIGTAGNDTLTGTAGNDSFYGLSGNDTIYGLGGNDLLDGGAGNDTMVGGAGNDTYVVDSTGDVVTELASEGTDTVLSSITYTLGANVENLTLTGTAAINGTGNTLDNIIIGNSGNNTLTGLAGNDTLDGGAGNDTMVGGAGNDTYVVDSTGDIVTESASAGTDTVLSSITYTLGANVENLTLTGTANINGTGNTLANILIGNSGNNILNGGAGNDTMQGGAGNDTYVVDSAGDVVTELISEGIDTVQSSITYTLTANVENLTLTGTAAINGTGNALDNVIIGNSGNNILNGGTGNDTMQGGAGNDTYVVDSAGDVVTESASAGTDTVQSSITYTLVANVENLTLTGTADINGTGNTLANILVGNSGNNILDGGAGNDTMQGGAGNDTYYVDSASDVVTESASAGTDTVLSSITYTLTANVENLTLTGTTAINGTGNAQDNLIIGNSSNNILDGKAGTDILKGGEGSDIYFVGLSTDHPAAEFTDSGLSGTDEVRFASTTASTLTLYAGDTGIEKVVIGTGTATAAVTTGTTALNVNASAVTNALWIIGNAGANSLTGTAYNDSLDGGAGNDSLIGGAGNDTLIGGNGNDTLTGGAGSDYFVFNVAANASSNKDTVTDFELGVDKLQFSKAVYAGLGSIVGPLSSGQFWSGAGVVTAHDADDRIIYNTTTGALYYDADGTGSSAAVQIAIIGTSTHPALAYSDISIVA